MLSSPFEFRDSRDVRAGLRSSGGVPSSGACDRGWGWFTNCARRFCCPRNFWAGPMSRLSSSKNKTVPECNRRSNHYMPTPKLAKEILTAAISGFEEQKRTIDTHIANIRAMLSGNGTEPTAATEPSGRPRRKMSAAARRKIAAAQRKRWAKAKAGSEPAKPKRRLSAAGRAAIIAATKKRWAALKAAKK
jgi:hypothetical protein